MKAGNIIFKTINILFVLIVIMAFIVDYISIKKESDPPVRSQIGGRS